MTADTDSPKQPQTFEEWFVTTTDWKSKYECAREAFAAGVASQQAERDTILLQLADALHEAADLKAEISALVDEQVGELKRYEAVVEAAREIMAAYADEFGPEALDEPPEYRWKRAVHSLRAALAALDQGAR